MAADVFLYLYKGPPTLEKSAALIKGGCTDKLFPYSIMLTSFSMDAKASIASSFEDTQQLENDADMMKMPKLAIKGKADKPLDSFSIEIKKEFDISSTELFKNYALTSTKAAVPFTRAEVYCRIGSPDLTQGMKPEQACFLLYEFESLVIFKYSLDVSDKSSIPSEKCSFYFDRYRITYRQPLKSGKLGTPLKLGWDFGKDLAF